MKVKTIHVGHPVYCGANHYRKHDTHASALADLLRRNVKMADAQRALALAKRGHHATCKAWLRAKDHFGEKIVGWNPVEITIS